MTTKPRCGLQPPPTHTHNHTNTGVTVCLYFTVSEQNLSEIPSGRCIVVVLSANIVLSETQVGRPTWQHITAVIVTPWKHFTWSVILHVRGQILHTAQAYGWSEWKTGKPFTKVLLHRPVDLWRDVSHDPASTARLPDVLLCVLSGSPGDTASICISACSQALFINFKPGPFKQSRWD